MIQATIQYIRDNFVFLVTRRGRCMNEGHGLSIVVPIMGNGLDMLGNPREIEYGQYLGMILDQIPRFKRYLSLDKFSRRLIFQFPMSNWEGTDKDYMPCIESFMVQFISETEYIVCVNFRSSEASRILEDLALIKRLCGSTWVGLAEYKMVRMYAHFFNVHEYLDGGTSDDFTAKTTRVVNSET